MEIFLITMHVLAAFVLVAVVLLQHGKGADIGATFGAGASQTVFGSRGAGNFLSKLTTFFVAVFMITSISLTYFANPAADMFDDAPVNAPGAQPSEVEELPAETIPGAQPIEEIEVEGKAPSESAVEEIAPPATAPTTPPVDSAPEAAPAPSAAPETPTAPQAPAPGGE